MTANPFIRITDDIRKEIEIRAYLIWESEGRPHGCSQEHWQRAEAEIMAAHMLAGVAAAEKPKKKAASKKTAKTSAKTAAPKTAEPKAVEHKTEAPAKTKAATKTKRTAKPKTTKAKHKEA